MRMIRCALLLILSLSLYLPAIPQAQTTVPSEKDPLVAQDLEIMIEATEQAISGTELSEKYDLQ